MWTRESRSYACSMVPLEIQSRPQVRQVDQVFCWVSAEVDFRSLCYMIQTNRGKLKSDEQKLDTSHIVSSHGHLSALRLKLGVQEDLSCCNGWRAC